MRVRPVFATAVGGLLLLIPSSTILLSGEPRVWAPYPMLVVFPAFSESPLGLVAPTLGFWVLGLKLFWGSDTIPTHSVAVFAVAAIANLGWLVAGWGYGLQYQGRMHTVFVACLNALFSWLLTHLMLLGRRQPLFRRAYFFHWSMFAWLGWCAFPYLGELP